MIDHGAGLINVPLDKWDVWNDLISKYYLSGDMKTLKDWTYVNGIQGVTFDHKQIYRNLILILKTTNKMYSKYKGLPERHKLSKRPFIY